MPVATPILHNGVLRARATTARDRPEVGYTPSRHCTRLNPLSAHRRLHV